VLTIIALFFTVLSLVISIIEIKEERGFPRDTFPYFLFFSLLTIWLLTLGI